MEHSFDYSFSCSFAFVCRSSARPCRRCRCRYASLYSLSAQHLSSYLNFGCFSLSPLASSSSSFFLGLVCLLRFAVALVKSVCVDFGIFFKCVRATTAYQPITQCISVAATTITETATTKEKPKQQLPLFLWFVICCCLCRKYLWFPGFCGFSAQAQHVAGLFHLALTPTPSHTHTKHSRRTYTCTHTVDIQQLVARSLHFFLSQAICVAVCKVFFSPAASCWQMQNFNLLIYCSDTSLKNTVTNTATHTRNKYTQTFTGIVCAFYLAVA